MAKKTLNIAHRGASGLEPENTLRAFHAAYEAKADGLELDVFLTADKIAVVTHDGSTERLTGVKHNVRKTKFDVLRTLDFGKGEKIPTLDEVLSEFIHKFSVINIEIKSTGLKTDGVEDAIAKSIKRHDCAEKILISSFNPLNLSRVKKLCPGARIGYLIDERFKTPPFHLGQIKKLKPNTLNLHPGLIKKRDTGIFFEMDIPFWIWNIDTASDWLFWIGKGAEALITDHPLRLHRVLHPESEINK